MGDTEVKVATKPGLTFEEIPEPPLVKKKKKKLTKAEKREIKRLAAIEFQKFELREELKRELEMSKRSAIRGQDDWEEMCREIKIVEMYQELVVWNEKTQRVLASKDEKVTAMLEDMTTTLEMHKRSYTKQMEILDHIIVVYKTLVQANKALHAQNCSELIQHFHEELNRKRKYTGGIKENMENAMFITSMLVERQLISEYNIYLDRKDDCINKEIVKRFALRDHIVEKMELSHQLLLNFIDSLQKEDMEEDRDIHAASLLEQQRIFVVETRKLNKDETQYSRTLHDIQRDFLRVDLELQRRTNELRLERSYFMQVRLSIAFRSRCDHEITFKKTKTLCTNSYYTNKRYEQLIEQGESLLLTTAVCRKLETEPEKVVPAGDEYGYIISNQEPDDEFFKLKAFNLAKHLDVTEEDLQYVMHHMRKFWRRQAIVQMQCMLLEREKVELRKQNNKYIDFIKNLAKAEKSDDVTPAVVITNLIPETLIPCPPARSCRLRRRKKK